jgi:hypothetical protein
MVKVNQQFWESNCRIYSQGVQRSSVGIATDYVVVRPGFDSHQLQSNFLSSAASRSVLKTNQLPKQWVQILRGEIGQDVKLTSI